MMGALLASSEYETERELPPYFFVKRRRCKLNTTTRKVFRSGAGLIMTLPKKWTDAAGIKRGDEVAVCWDAEQMTVVKVTPILFRRG